MFSPFSKSRHRERAIEVLGRRDLGRGVCLYLGQLLRLTLGRIDQHALDEDRAVRINPLGDKLTLAEIKGGGRSGCSLADEAKARAGED